MERARPSGWWTRRSPSASRRTPRDRGRPPAPASAPPAPAPPEHRLYISDYRDVDGVKSNEKGLATLEGLTPGTYVIQAEFPGFEPRVMKDVRLRNGDNRQVAILTIQSLQDEVTVGRALIASNPLTNFKGPEQSQNFGINLGGTLVSRKSSFALSVNGGTFYDAPTIVNEGPDGRKVETLPIKRGATTCSRTATSTTSTYTFESIEAFEAGMPRSYSRRVGDALISYSNVLGAFYVQDDIRIRKNLTLSPGLRYEAQTHIDDVDNFGPRVGINWAPFKSGRTTVRASWGIFYDCVCS